MTERDRYIRYYWRMIYKNRSHENKALIAKLQRPCTTKDHILFSSDRFLFSCGGIIVDNAPDCKFLF